jgi:membrane protease subunit (stomatin/prohibitin family)
MAISDVIKYEGDNSTFIWKHPDEDFNTTTQLIVHESQEAIFFLNGQALDLFGPGRHTLETQNIPLLRKVLNLPTGGETPFHCEVYFINKTEQLAIKWGTDSKVQYMEPTYGFPIYIGASGEMGLSVDNSRKLLVKLVGTEKEFSQTQMQNYFRMFLMTRIKTYIAQEMKSSAISIFEIDEHLTEFSNSLKSRLIPDFDEYGVALSQFFVTTIVKPDGDPQYEEFKTLFFRQYADIKDAQIRQQVGVIDQETDAKRKVIDAGATAQKRQIEGFTYQQERGFDVAEKVAQNEGVGEFSNMGIGLGMVAGVGGPIGSTVGGIVGDAMNAATAPMQSMQQSGGATTHPASAPQTSNSFCENCGAALSVGSSFCDECGTPVGFGKCSNCGYTFMKPSKFCPKCGTKREG